MNREAVKAFYDDFLQSRMLEYRVRGNRRIDRAVDLVLKHVTPESKVLDLGCGIGMVAERVASAAPRGYVWACDISDRNIWYAQKTVSGRNITFFVADLVGEFEACRRHVAAPVDLVILVDVIEHIPLRDHAAVFRNIRSVCHDGSRVALTYPSPQYQAHVRKHSPSELQIIDESVELPHLLNVAQAAGFQLRYFSLESVWLKDEYVHCVFQVAEPVRMLHRPPLQFAGRLLELARAAAQRFIVWPYRRRKYVRRVFSGSETEARLRNTRSAQHQRVRDRREAGKYESA